MRTNSTLLSLLFLSSACVGRVFADGIAEGGEGEETSPQALARIQNPHADEAEEPESTRVPHHGDPRRTPPRPHHESTTSGSGASVGSTSTADTDTTVVDAVCSAVDGSSCSTAAAATAATSKDQQDKSQQQQQQEPPGDEEGAVKVETGEQDGVRIEFVGRTEGKIPEPERPGSSSSSSSSSSSARGADGAAQMPAAAAAAAAAPAEVTKFELLRCDGESHRDGTEGGLTAKGVWNHLRSKLESSWEEGAQWVRLCVLYLSFFLP